MLVRRLDTLSLWCDKLETSQVQGGVKLHAPLSDSSTNHRLVFGQEWDERHPPGTNPSGPPLTAAATARESAVISIS
jgi:hypothetical protein